MKRLVFVQIEHMQFSVTVLKNDHTYFTKILVTLYISYIHLIVDAKMNQLNIWKQEMVTNYHDRPKNQNPTYCFLAQGSDQAISTTK